MLTRAPSLIWSPNRSLSEQGAEPGQRDTLHRAQVDHIGAQLRPERRARFKPLRRLRLEGLGAARADPAMQYDPGHVRFDLGDLDMLVGLHRLLRRTRHIRPATLADIGLYIALAGRIGVQRAMSPAVRLALGFRLARTRRLLTP